MGRVVRSRLGRRLVCGTRLPTLRTNRTGEIRLFDTLKTSQVTAHHLIGHFFTTTNEVAPVLVDLACDDADDAYAATLLRSAQRWQASSARWMWRTTSSMRVSMRVSKRSSSHDSTEATAVPLTSTRLNRMQSQICSQSKEIRFTSRNSHCSFPVRDASCHVTLDTD